MRHPLALLVLVLAIGVGGCRGEAAPPFAAEPLVSAAQPIPTPAPTPAVAPTPAPTPTKNSLSAWVECEPGVAGRGTGMCVSPPLEELPTRYCEEAAGVCHEAMPVRSSVLSVDPGISVGATLREVYRTLTQYYVDPIEPRAVFQGAIDSVERELRSRGIQAPSAELPPLAGNAEADWGVFSARYRALADLAPAVPSVQQELGQAAVRGMAASLHEGHTVFLTPREYEDLKGWQRGDVSYAGIGARLAGSPPMIFEVFADSPAERAGLEYGDTITAANGRSASALRLDEIVGLLRGDAGTSVRMTVQHPDGEQNDLTLVRAKVKVDFVTSTTLDGRVGYIRLRGFPEPKVAAAVEQAIDDFRARDLRELVVDLRGNSGGRLDVGMETLGLFMANTDAYVEVTREGRRTVRTANRRAPAAGLRTAVLVDAATSSMGEIFAAAIKEHQSGQVVGTNTAGSVAAGRVFALADGSALQVTVSRLESAAGITINEHGVEPNVFVARGPDDVRNGRDPQLESALAFLADGSISLGAPKNSSPAQ